MNEKMMTMLVAAACALAVQGERAIDGNEWQDLSRMSLGREKTRAAFAPFADERAALEILPWKTDRQVCLDSDTAWKFKWVKEPSLRPVGFEKLDYDVSGWETIKVPCSWQAYGANGKGGWGTALYTNARYPFKMNPPYVMDEPPKNFTNYDARNPVGSYRRDFELPASWKGDRVFLKFDGVDSFYYLWVNGKYVGFTKDSRCAAEYDVTDIVKPGKNTVALEVYRYSDGSYLEDQDMFRLSGIFRSVWLVRRPQVYIRDFFVRAKPAQDGVYDGDWTMTVEMELGWPRSDAIVGQTNRDSAMVELSLFDMNGKRVPIEMQRDQTFKVKSPKLWSHETPNCYKVVLSLTAVEGRPPLECVSTLFGFRESKIINGRYCLNGKKVKLCGADRHETDPMYGHYCPHARQEEDVKLLKRANCTLVRNSHYPQDDYWYYLCDLNGIALMDEANVETHGMGYGKGSSSHDPRFTLATVWRNMNMVERNKNHPSVLFWSHGNESGPGKNFKAADDAVHARDWSRPTHYERDWSASDIDSNMYPSVDHVRRRAADTKSKRPYFLCEYAHNMMNAMGNLKDYQDAFESSDVIIGGCIWDWVDQGLYKKNKDGKMIIAYGGDFGDAPTDGQFVMNGCILSDRALEPAYWEIKHVYQPVSVTADASCQFATIRNKQFFRGLDRFDAKETILVNGKAVSSRTIDVSCVSPRGEKTIAIPAAAHEANKPGNSVSVRYEFIAKESEGFIEKGYVVANDQIDLPNDKRAQALGMKLMDMVVHKRKEGARRTDGSSSWCRPAALRRSRSTAPRARSSRTRSRAWSVCSRRWCWTPTVRRARTSSVRRRSGASAAGATSDRRRFPSARSGETTTTRTRSRSRWRWSAGARPRSRWSTTGGRADTSRRRARRRVFRRRTSAPSCAGASMATARCRAAARSVPSASTASCRASAGVSSSRSTSRRWSGSDAVRSRTTATASPARSGASGRPTSRSS